MESQEKAESDVYIRRLAEVNNTNAVVATADIVNADGAIILKQGARVGDETVERLLKFKLLKPIEDCVGLQDMLTADQLYEQIPSLLQEFNGAQELFQQAGIDEDYKKHCSQLEKYPVLQQKLTVQKIEMSDEFIQSQMTAWMSLCLCKRLGLDEEQTHAVFIAALTHDSGLLHIDPEITRHKGELSQQQWRTLQCHVVIGQKILNGIGVSKLASQAVLEHHERCDGSGYPVGRMGDELSIEGQIVAMCDTILAIYIKRLAPKDRSMADLIPILQLNSEQHFYSVYSAVIQWLKEAFSEESQPALILDFNAAVEQLDKTQTDLTQKLTAVSHIKQQIDANPNHRRLNAVRACKAQIDKVVNSSGILTKEYLLMLQDADPNDEAICKELEDTSLMLEELGWRLQNIGRILQGVRDQQSDVSVGLLESVNKCLTDLDLKEHMV